MAGALLHAATCLPTDFASSDCNIPSTEVAISRHSDKEKSTRDIHTLTPAAIHPLPFACFREALSLRMGCNQPPHQLCHQAARHSFTRPLLVVLLIHQKFLSATYEL